MNEDVIPPPTHRNLDEDSHWDFSDKITLLSFAMCVMIVYLHSKFLYDDGNHALNQLHQFIVVILNTCVPTFFAISGYLFFRNFKIGQLNDKLHRRIKSLAIPYFIWNTLYVAFFITISVFGLSSFYLECSPKNITIAILNAECSPLWFVRYLMYFVLIAPITYILLRNRLAGAIIILAILFFNYYNYIAGRLGNHINVNANSLVMFNYQYAYYAIGAYAALNYSHIVETYSKVRNFMGLGVLALLIGMYWLYLRDCGNMASFHLFRFIWIPALWFSIDALPSIKPRQWMKFAFFIYCSHMFLIYGIQGMSEIIYNRLTLYWQPFFACAVYLLMGVLIVVTLICIAQIWKKHFPKVFNIVSGSRG